MVRSVVDMVATVLKITSVLGWRIREEEILAGVSAYIEIGGMSMIECTECGCSGHEGFKDEKTGEIRCPNCGSKKLQDDEYGGGE